MHLFHLHGDELDIDLHRRGRREQDRDGKAGRNSPLISGGERRRVS